jgi:hypothetical protein
MTYFQFYILSARSDSVASALLQINPGIARIAKTAQECRD